MLHFFDRLVLAFKFWTRLNYTWHRAWHNARRDHNYDEHVDVRGAGTL